MARFRFFKVMFAELYMHIQKEIVWKPDQLGAHDNRGVGKADNKDGENGVDCCLGGERLEKRRKRSKYQE